MLVALFSERESYAVYFLQQQDMSRLDAVTYISHGVGKGETAARAAPRSRAPRRPKQEEGKKKPESALKQFTVNLNEKARGRPGRSADRPRAGGRPHRPDPLPPLEEQPALCGRSRRRQDRDRRRAGAQDRRGRRARGAEAGGHLLARHGRAARRHPLSRRFRGAAEGGRQRAREAARRDPVHRRDPHRDRRRRHLGRRDGRVEPAEAGALQRRRSAASARPPTRSSATISRRTGRCSGASRRSTSTSRRSRTRSRSSPACAPRSRSITTSNTRPTRSRRRSSFRRATSTTASCPTRRST